MSYLLDAAEILFFFVCFAGQAELNMYFTFRYLQLKQSFALIIILKTFNETHYIKYYLRRKIRVMSPNFFTLVFYAKPNIFCKL